LYFRNKKIYLTKDDYYKELTEEQSKMLYNDAALINFDEPNAINFELLISHLNDLLNKKVTVIPKFDLGSCVVTKMLTVDPSKYKYIILEGVFILCNEALLRLCNLKIWTECSEYVCALRRFMKYTRDIHGYTPDFVYNQCVKFVIPGFFNIRINF
jgi:uridine kinase